MTITEKEIQDFNKNDPWIHRSTEMKCKTCMYFVPKATQDGSDSHSQLGRCRRNAPTMNGFPVVFPDDWCGNHKIDEEKLLLG